MYCTCELTDWLNLLLRSHERLFTFLYNAKKTQHQSRHGKSRTKVARSHKTRSRRRSQNAYWRKATKSRDSAEARDLTTSLDYFFCQNGYKSVCWGKFFLLRLFYKQIESYIQWNWFLFICVSDKMIKLTRHRFNNSASDLDLLTLSPNSGCQTTTR